MSLAFKLKYGKKDFSKVAQKYLVNPPPPDFEWGGKRVPEPCGTQVSGGRLCGHLKSSHRQHDKKHRCLAVGCPCLGFTSKASEG